MIELIAENGALRGLLLLLLFIGVAAVSYFSTRAVGIRQMTRRRLVEPSSGSGGTAALASLRTDRVQSSWLKLVDAIEKRGLSLVDTKDKAIRQKLIAAAAQKIWGHAYAPAEERTVPERAVVEVMDWDAWESELP